MRVEGLLKDIGFTGEVRYGEPMSKHTTLGIGGPAEAMVFPTGADELSRLLSQAAKSDVPVFLLGAGSNLLVLDGGIPGITVNTSGLDWLEFERTGDGLTQVHAGAGLSLIKLVKRCADAGFSGLEFAAGIPGTVGGAVLMNAGAGGSEMKDVLTGVTLVGKDGQTVRLDAGAIKMEYRKSSIPEGSVVVDARFALVPWPVEEARELVAANIRRRKATQPSGVRSAGSTFKNPPGYSAWKLIDMAGLRGVMVGKAQVCTQHTNFLINTGGATAKDFRALMDLVIDTTLEKMNIRLEPEIRVVGVEKE